MHAKFGNVWGLHACTLAQNMSALPVSYRKGGGGSESLVPQKRNEDGTIQRLLANLEKRAFMARFTEKD